MSRTLIPKLASDGLNVMAESTTRPKRATDPVRSLPINANVQATLVRSRKRRSIGIKVHKGLVTVSAPPSVPLYEIQAFIARKATWIQKHVDLQKASLEKAAPLTLAPGGVLPFLGTELRLEASFQRLGVVRDGERLLIGSDERMYKARIARWLMGQAQAYLPGRIAHFAPQVGVEPKGFSVRFYKSRWGSCNRRGELQFNWLLMMAPLIVVDYVVIHELAHLQHFNHSPDFWRLVARVMPDYAQHRAWLKQQTSLVW